MPKRVRRVVMFVVALVLVACAWELYKVVGPEAGGKIAGWTLLPRSGDKQMPHVWEWFARFGDVEASFRGQHVWQIVLKAMWYSLRLVVLGFLLGSLVGVGLAIVMARLKVVERGLLPLLVASQTIPLIALAPLVVSWGGKLSIGGFEWEKWMSAVVLGAFLAFFPIAVNTLKGLTSPKPESLELMNSYAASWWQTLIKLRFPAAIPYMVPGFKLAASASVFGVLVSEMSTAVDGGVGRLIIKFANEATSKPARMFTAVLGTIVLGLLMAGLVALAESRLMRHRPKESLI